MKLRFETTLDALAAAALLLLTNIAEKFTSGQIESITEISEASWWVLASGAAGAFWKAYQTLTMRRAAAKLRGRTYEPS